jgi:hypothetical protein
VSVESALPPSSEVYPWRQLVGRHPNLLSEPRVQWALRNRRRNGLQAAHAVFDSPCGELLIHEPAFLTWFLGLAGRAKPRSTRRSAACRRRSPAL